MTISTYFYTFGFLIKKDVYLKYFGYTTDKLPEEYKSESDDPEYDIDEALYEWILETHGSPFYREFDVDGVNYIVRSFTHDSNDSEYVVIGIDVGSLHRWDATQTSGTDYNPKHHIQTLTHNEDWIKMIQESDRNCTNYKKIEYGVQHPKYKSFSICPCVYITTDDCDCCS